MLYLLEGPAGGGKSQLARDMLDAGQVDLLADVTALWVALSAVTRDSSGRYPVRDNNDPALRAALYLQTTVARYGLREGLKVAVTTSQSGQAARWRALADELDTAMSVMTVDPGEDVARARLADPQTGQLSGDCVFALSRWYT